MDLQKNIIICPDCGKFPNIRIILDKNDNNMIKYKCHNNDYISISPEEFLRFQEALSSFPDKFTWAEAESIFREWSLISCLSLPPANYRFHCKHILWELNSDYEPLYYDPILLPNTEQE